MYVTERGYWLLSHSEPDLHEHQKVLSLFLFDESPSLDAWEARVAGDLERGGFLDKVDLSILEEV